MKTLAKIFMSWALTALILFALIPSRAYAERKLYSITSLPNDNRLRVIDPTTGATISSVTITLPGRMVTSGNGLARDPTTGKLWALLTLVGQTGRHLVTIDPSSGLATGIGNTGDLFAGLAFKSDGTLYGVTGDGAAIPESLFTLNKLTGAANLVLSLGNGDSGETIAFNPNNGLLYHASGSSSQVFESINPTTFAIINIPQSGSTHGEVLVMTYSHSDILLMTDSTNLYQITTSGVVSLLGSSAPFTKGLAFLPNPPADFDRDIKSDIGIYRDGEWSILRSSDGGTTSVGWGGPTWEPVQADYDGDGKVDIAVRNASNGLWSILRSSDGGNTLFGWSAAANDVPVPADYDGDGKADIALYNNATAGWSIIRSSDGGLTYRAWGGPAWAPVEADYDGDGKVDIAVRNASSGLWSILRSSDGGNTLFGWSAAANDIPVPADYDGDGKADFAVYNTASGGWSIIRSSDGGLTYKAWGGPGWIPVPADYDGDGKADIAVYNPSNGLWSILRSSDGGNTLVGLGGAPQDIPLN